MHARDNPELKVMEMQGTTAQFPPLTDDHAPKVESTQPPANKGPHKQAKPSDGTDKKQPNYPCPSGSNLQFPSNGTCIHP